MVNKKKAKIAFESIASGDAKPRTGFSIKVADRSLLGREAVFEIEKKASVKDSRPVNRSQVIFSKTFLLQSETTFVEIDKEQLRAYTYRGSKIDISLRTKLKVDDGILFDTTVTEEQELRLGTKPSIADNAKMIIDPYRSKSRCEQSSSLSNQSHTYLAVCRSNPILPTSFLSKRCLRLFARQT